MSKKIIFVVIPLVSLILIFFAKEIALLYINDEIDVVNQSVLAIRCMAVDLVFLALLEIITSYWQGIGRTKDMGIVIVFQRLILPVLFAIVLGKLFGIVGVWISFPLTSAFTIFFVCIYGSIKYFKTIFDYKAIFSIPKNCVENSELMLEFTITEERGIYEWIPKVQSFAINNNVDKSRALFLAICFEELTKNIIMHGFPLNNHKNEIDVFIVISNDQITMRIRDNCKKFDPIKKNEQLSKIKNDYSQLGLKTVIKISKGIKYIHNFGNNNVIITF